MSSQQQQQQPQIVQQPVTVTHPMQQTAPVTYPTVDANGAAPAGGAGINGFPGAGAAPAAYNPPHVTPMPQMTYPAPQGTTAPQYAAYGQAPQPYYYSQPQAPAVTAVPVVSIISPEDTKKIRKMQWINFACTMLQLACAVAIICVVREQLAIFTSVSTTVGGGIFVDYYCLAATPAWQGTCEYAYALASTSIFFCFILSLMQCLTMDCCGMGRVLEAVFDGLMAMWWTAGTVTLAVRAHEANGLGLRKEAARNAVVALSAISAFMFWALLVTNAVLIKRLGKAYKATRLQMQQHTTAHYPPAIPLGTYPQPQGHPTGPVGAPAGPSPTPATGKKDVENAL